jgi:hypothetical protein
VQQNPAIPASVRDQIEQAAPKGIPVVPVSQVEKTAIDKGLPADQAKAVADDYGDAELQGLRRAIGAVAIFAAMSFWFTRKLPGRKEQTLAPEDDARPVAASDPSPAALA